MKSKYYFIDGDDPSPRMVVYRLMVGRSAREQRALQRLWFYKVGEPSVFFQKYDDACCKFIERLACSIYDQLSPGGALQKFSLENVREISIFDIFNVISANRATIKPNVFGKWEPFKELR